VFNVEMSLARYKAKRNFSASGEPGGKKRTRAAAARNRVLFVIQKHAARRLHYDFRLEIGGVLKSWAVPKGVPMMKGDKRLAMEVEDHPSDYANFEGVIPAGNYGAGTVMLWDAGICDVLNDKPAAAWREGKLELLLAGKKLKGNWTLVRMRPGEDETKHPWLLIKSGEDGRPISARAEDRSVQSERTMKQIAADADETWQSNRKTRPAAPARPKRGARSPRPSGTRPRRRA
jgi:bifunctional non-homologous end joining protein LigD